MQKLHLVGFTTDQQGLILSARRGARSGSYHLPVDDALAEAVEELHARRAQEQAEAEHEVAVVRPPRVESALPVKEIQARLRQGRSVADVAKAAGVEVEWVDRFAAPVFAEQAQVIRRVQATRLQRARLGPSAMPISDAIRHHLADRDVSMSPEEFDGAWSTRQMPDGRWVVGFAYRSRGKDQRLRFEQADGGGPVVAADRLSSQLGYVAGPSSPPAASGRTSATERRDPDHQGAKRAMVASGFRADTSSPKPTSRPAKERERAAAAMSKAAAQRAQESERATARRAQEKAAATAKAEREARAEAARAAREAIAQARAREAAERAEAAAAAKVAKAKAVKAAKAAEAQRNAAEAKRNAAEAKRRAAQAKRAEAALRAAERAHRAEAKRAAAAKSSRQSKASKPGKASVPSMAAKEGKAAQAKKAGQAGKATTAQAPVAARQPTTPPVAPSASRKATAPPARPVARPPVASATSSPVGPAARRPAPSVPVTTPAEPTPPAGAGSGGAAPRAQFRPGLVEPVADGPAPGTSRSGFDVGQEPASSSAPDRGPDADTPRTVPPEGRPRRTRPLRAT